MIPWGKMAHMRVAIWLFLMFCGLFALTSGGHLYASDAVQKLAVLDALFSHHTFAIPDGWVKGLDGARYSWFPLGASLVMLPGWAIAKALLLLDPSLPESHITRFCVSFENSVISAALVTLEYAIVRRMGLNARAALLTALGLGLGTAVWPYAKTAWSEPATALCLYGGLMAIWLARNDARHLLLAGTGLAMAVAIRQETLIPATAAIGWWVWRRGSTPPSVVPGLACLMTPLCLVGAVALTYNQIRYGAPFSMPNYVLPQKAVIMSEGRFSWSLRNLYQYTFSPNQGILWYSPAVLGGIAGLLYRAHRPPTPQPQPSAPRTSSPTELLELLTLALVPLGLFYVFGWGLSSWAWGLRYTYLFLPALMLPFAWAPLRVKALTFGLGVAVQLIAILHNPQDLYERELARSPGLSIQLLMIRHTHAPLWLAIKETPDTLTRGIAVLEGHQPPGNVLREQRQHLPDFWWILALLEPIPRRVITLVFGALLLLTITASFGLHNALTRSWRPLA